VGEVLAVLQTVDESIKTLEKTVNEGLAPVQESVSYFKKSLSAFMKVVETIVAVKAVMEAGELAYDQYKEKYETSDKKNASAASDNEKTSCVNRQVKTFSDDYLALLNAYKRAIGEIKEPVKEIKSLIPQVKASEKEIEKVTEPLGKFMEKVGASLQKPIKKMNKLLNEKVDFQFKVKIWGYRHSFNVRLISMKEALKGAKHIGKKLEERMSSETKEAAKKYGWEKLTKEIEKTARKEFKKVSAEVIARLKEIKNPEFAEMMKKLEEAKKSYEKMDKALNKVIHIALPDYDKNFYRKIREEKFEYFEKQCGS
jgi:methyl-accepting chemotaxis protein